MSKMIRYTHRSGILSESPYESHNVKLNSKEVISYNSLHPVYHYTEQFSNNVETYRESTKWFGIFLAVLSGIFFTISSALVKGMKSVEPMILLSIGAIAQILAMIIVVCKEAKNPFGLKGHRLLIQLQGLVGGMTLSLMYYSFRKLPLGDATTIIFSSPVIVIVLSFLFLKEPCGILRITVICVLSAGIVLVARPPILFQMNKNAHYDVTGYICALLATLFTALNIVIMRKCLATHYSVKVLNLAVWSLISAISFFTFVPINGPLAPFMDRLVFPSDWFSWEIIIMVAFTGLLGQVMVTKALNIEGAGKISVTRSLDVILAYFIQIYFFGEIPSTTSAIGALLIFFSVIFMGFEKEIYGICDFIP